MLIYLYNIKHSLFCGAMTYAFYENKQFCEFLLTKNVSVVSNTTCLEYLTMVSCTHVYTHNWPLIKYT